MYVYSRFFFNFEYFNTVQREKIYKVEEGVNDINE